MKNLKIDPEFQSLLPPLSDEEFKQLEESVKIDGCREALVIWQEILVDGHNRYRICQENGISFGTKEIEFYSREEAAEWIIRNQLRRRNLSFAQRSELAMKLKPVIQEKAKANHAANGGYKKAACEKSNTPKIDTYDELAKIAGVSSNTIRKTEKILSKGTPEQIDRARKGGKGNSVNAVYKEVTGKAEPLNTEEPVDDMEDDSLEARMKRGRQSLLDRLAGRPMKMQKLSKEDKARISASVQKTRQGPVGKPSAELAALEFEHNLKHIFGLLEGLLKNHLEDLKDADTNKKIMAVLSEAATTIDEWKGKYSYERL